MQNIGFVGLGAMGTPMAWNIHRAGYPLAVYNRSPSRAEPFRAEGITVCVTPRELAAQSAVVVIMVTGPSDLLAVMQGPDGLGAELDASKTVVNMSTVSPKAVDEAAKLSAEKGAAFVDAPVSGSVKPAQDRTLVILAGADPTVLSRVKPILLTMGKDVVECGGVGDGTRMKLVLNTMLGNMMQSLAEALTLGKRLGLDQEMVLKALANGPMNAPFFQAKGRSIIDHDFAPQFPVHLMFKDLNLALAASGEARVPLPQTASTRECYAAAMARGLEHEDMAAVVKGLELLTGIAARK